MSMSIPNSIAPKELYASAPHLKVDNMFTFEDSVPCRVRAKRGCATHPRSIAERVRRTRISDRIRKLQELVPNMDKGWPATLEPVHSTRYYTEVFGGNNKQALRSTAYFVNYWCPRLGIIPEFLHIISSCYSLAGWIPVCNIIG
ncbi:hypothetical protein LR48_Vigan08g215600 [Vigna angularis]|uniref:Uncharacterized protein n=1 Tax=Phaseolus angularis TaxID=3914 RepID=A0A0L9V9K5_PHAAN|nr:hypothetical protein LR48_Vigan08g215600 [Vigna angularis]